MVGFESLYRAYTACRKNKRNTLNALRFEQDLITNLWSLEHELRTRRYAPGRSICFLASSPKLREVFAADFRDRVVHHLLVSQIEPFYERRFIYDVYNNRKGKGIHTAVKRAQKFARVMPYYLQLDIKGFFYSLDKRILFDILKQDIEKSMLEHKETLLWLSNRVIFHDPTQNHLFKGDPRLKETLPPHKTLFKIPKHKGLPIGNLTSQFFANVYLNWFDHFVKRVLKVKHYVRYVDDFVLFGPSKAALLEQKAKIESYLYKKLALTLRDDFKLKRVAEGLDFLGYIIRPDYLLVRQRVVRNFKYKKARYLDAYEAQKGKMGREEIKRFLSVQASFAGHCAHADSYKLLNKVGKIDEKDPFMFDR